MSLKQNMSYQDYKKAMSFSISECECIARLANLKIVFNESKKPGEILIKYLDRDGVSLQQYNNFLTSMSNSRPILTYYRPQSKVAILIANEKYTNLSKLVTPSIDCEALATHLTNLDFIVVIIKNTLSRDLKIILQKVISTLPENSYCFIFYAGHGCEVCNTKCMLSIDCPVENVDITHCVTENFILREVAKCKPELCILIMDTCRYYLDRNTNRKIYASIPFIEEFTVYNNLVIAYTTQSSQAAYEVLQIECSTTIDNNYTYELKTGDTDRIVPCASQYVNALCRRMDEDLDVNSLLDKVHADVENSLKKQRPIKVQCGVAKRSLYDRVTGDNRALFLRLQESCQDYPQHCSVLDKS